jgi:hypothetical protein
MHKYIERWDDERNSGNGIIITLNYGYSFEYAEHCGVMGFDTVTEAKQRSRRKEIYSCECWECKEHNQ